MFQSQSVHPTALEFFRCHNGDSLSLPLVTQGISCGFPSPAQDYFEQFLDLNQHLIRDREATFLGRVKGNSMVDANICDGDVLIIDCSMDSRSDSIALCMLNGEFTVKRMEIHGGGLTLHPANNEYHPIRITPEMDFLVWGIVTYVIHKVA